MSLERIINRIFCFFGSHLYSVKSTQKKVIYICRVCGHMEVFPIK